MSDPRLDATHIRRTRITIGPAAIWAAVAAAVVIATLLVGM